MLIPLVFKGDQIHILFEKRSSKLSSQPGDVCFPGGAVEGDENPVETALRETEEEIGINRESIKVLGRGNDLYGFNNFTIHTVIGSFAPDSLKYIEPSPGEVAGIFTVPLKWFIQNPPRLYPVERISRPLEGFPYEEMQMTDWHSWRISKHELPIWTYEGEESYIWGEKQSKTFIWGITGDMLLDFLRLPELIKLFEGNELSTEEGINTTSKKAMRK